MRQLGEPFDDGRRWRVAITLGELGSGRWTVDAVGELGPGRWTVGARPALLHTQRWPVGTVAHVLAHGFPMDGDRR